MPECTRQRESFPKLDLVAANAAMERMDAAVCVFELRKRMIGQAFITEVDDEEIILNSIIIDHDKSCDERQDHIKTINAPVALDRNRRLFSCPYCGAKKWALYYSCGWSCADCLRLIYRSQLVDKEVKLWEEWDELRSQLRWGRPKGMHNRTYMKARQRLFALDNLLEGPPP